MSAADHRNALVLAWTRDVTLGSFEGRAVTGEPAFAFYGRTAHVRGRVLRPVGGREPTYVYNRQHVVMHLGTAGRRWSNPTGRASDTTIA